MILWTCYKKLWSLLVEQPSKNGVSFNYVSPKGYTYKIDGKNVIQNNSIEEIDEV